MAFMMPVVKNDWDIYKSNRSRKTSECNTSCTSRTRKISECVSEGHGSISNNRLMEAPIPKHHSVPDRMPSRAFTSRSRTSSEHLPNRAKTSIPSERNVSASASNLKPTNGGGWLDKLKRFMKNRKKSEEERLQ
ncbi:uncharacterized protein [Euwallacea similis]|uniref:uncharacterized protein n=1 Tax=Euwallacea similis TaxID=1736056 RepID=UPI00344C0FE3